MGEVATKTYSVLSRIESCMTKDEIECIKTDFKKSIALLAKEQNESVSSFIKAAIICGDLKVLRLFNEAFPNTFKKIASPYMETNNKKMAKFLAETLG